VSIKKALIGILYQCCKLLEYTLRGKFLYSKGILLYAVLKNYIKIVFDVKHWNYSVYKIYLKNI
jgi:hypothetical protein